MLRGEDGPGLELVDGLLCMYSARSGWRSLIKYSEVGAQDEKLLPD